MKILALHQNEECSFCKKKKPKIYEVELETGQTPRLCLKDLEKMIDMLFEVTEKKETVAK